MKASINIYEFKYELYYHKDKRGGFGGICTVVGTDINSAKKSAVEWVRKEATINMRVSPPIDKIPKVELKLYQKYVFTSGFATGGGFSYCIDQMGEYHFTAVQQMIRDAKAGRPSFIGKVCANGCEEEDE